MADRITLAIRSPRRTNNDESNDVKNDY